MDTNLKNVVLVDDDQDDREFFADAIASLDIPFTLHSYKNALEVVSEIQSGSFNVPYIMFLDINMPGMSGFELLEMIRNMEQFRSVPVIAIYSTSSDNEDINKSIKLGANGYITKPTSFQNLQSVIVDVTIDNIKNRAHNSKKANFDQKNFIILQNSYIEP
ncbi:response regulator [Flavobacterium johnsoniae]|nr:response regulator [Flavobacterium johnsoniae]